MDEGLKFNEKYKEMGDEECKFVQPTSLISIMNN